MEEQNPAGSILDQEIKELAPIFDRWEFALEADSQDAKRAEKEFSAKVKQMYDERVSGKFPGVDFFGFQALMRSQCREWLRKNEPIRPTKPNPTV